jgi:hypothetical protein
MSDYLTKVIKLEIHKHVKWVGGARDGEPCSRSELAATLRTSVARIAITLRFQR